MNRNQPWRWTFTQLILSSLVVLACLTLRFAPNWVTFCREASEAYREVTGTGEELAVKRAVLSGYGKRGFYVTEQSLAFNAEIDDRQHKIVRWRLLMPAVGHFFRLPGWATLGLAHVGCALLVIFLMSIVMGPGSASAWELLDVMCFGIVAGATAPFFVSMGWLGYYDSWLAIALLGVAFAPTRPWVWLACLAAPWIDERFVLGLPVALMVRRVRSEAPSSSWWDWIKAEALLPLILVTLYTVVRLWLGGRSGSETVGDYFRQFVMDSDISIGGRLFGAWSGLRLAWIPVALAFLLGMKVLPPSRRGEIWALAMGSVITGLIGLFTALDMSRSQVLLISVVPLGWIFGSRAAWWKRVRAAALLAIAALALPASHAVGKFAIPVDSFASPATPLLTAENKLGVMYFEGQGVPVDYQRAMKWFRRAADQGHAEAQFNVGVLYYHGCGAPMDSAQAEYWYLRSGENGYAPAQGTLGALYAIGAKGFPRDTEKSLQWFQRAIAQDNAEAKKNLGVLYALGDALPRDDQAAFKLLSAAAEQGNAEAQRNLGALYYEGRGLNRDLVRAWSWFRLSADAGEPLAKENLLTVQLEMDAEQQVEAAKLAQELVKKNLQRRPAFAR